MAIEYGCADYAYTYSPPNNMVEIIAVRFTLNTFRTCFVYLFLTYSHVQLFPTYFTYFLYYISQIKTATQFVRAALEEIVDVQVRKEFFINVCASPLLIEVMNRSFRIAMSQELFEGTRYLFRAIFAQQNDELFEYAGFMRNNWIDVVNVTESLLKSVTLVSRKVVTGKPGNLHTR